MRITFVIGLVMACLSTGPVWAVNLVVKGQPVAEIVITAEAGPSIVLAAQELQRHLEKISGARLPIVTNASAEVATKVYLGESEHTRKFGITLEDVKYDGFKIVAKDNWVVLVGREFSVASIMGRYAFLDLHLQRKLWAETTGKQWRFPAFLSSYAGLLDGVYADDGTGTLYAVYDLLEQLGMRWYLPMADIGIVYPELKDVRIATQNLKREPQFPVRQFINRSTRFDDWYWYKSMKMGNSMIVPQIHTVEYVMAAGTNNLPADIYATVGGKVDYRTPKLNSENLRREETDFLEATIAAYPGLNRVSLGFPDGWTAMDDDDTKTWRRPGDGWGVFSDYAWQFLLDVRRRIKEKHPEMQFQTWAYHAYKLPPTASVEIPDDLYLTFCQNSTLWMTPDTRRDLQVREDWLKRLGNNRMIVYDYYFQHAPPRNFPPIPVIFTKFMEENFRGMYERVLGFWVDTPWISGDFPEEAKAARSFLRRPGLGHLMFYLHNRFAWDAKLDLNAVLNEYYELFFGPARKEMKEFYEFAEEVWVRPVSHHGVEFLDSTDITRYFDILERAKAKAGDSIYGKRVDLIASEMASLTDLQGRFARTGPTVRGYRRWGKSDIDGNLEKPFWNERGATFQDQGFHIFHQLTDSITGEEPPHLRTTASFRWLSNNTALIVGIECLEPQMESLKATCTENDSTGIFQDDTVEIRLETPQGLRPVIVVNSAGVVYDACVTPNVADLPTFYSVGAVAVRNYPGRWTVEVQIDTKTLGVEIPPGLIPWGIQISRRRMAGNTPETYMLSPSGGACDDPTSMANLVL